MKALKTAIHSLLNSYSGILFISEPGAGLVLLALSTLMDPNLGLSGLICVLSAYGFARLIGLKEDFLRLDYYIYNPLLVGLSVGYYFRLDPLTLLFIILLGIFTFLLTYGLSSFLSYYLRLPVLSLPFVIGSLVATLASYHYSNLLVTSLKPTFHYSVGGLPLWLEGFFRSLGAIFFMPHPLPGFIVFALILRFSRILALLAALGYFSGTLMAYLFTGSSYQVFSNPIHFNYVLISMALGGVFLIPSPRSYLLAILGAVVAVPITEASRVFWEKFGLPAFALPFNLVTLLFLYALIVSGFRKLTALYKGTPEKTLDHHLSFEIRFPSLVPEVDLPVSGRWLISQGPDGQFTHKGPWRHALDFVVADENGRTFAGEGMRPEDYYAYRKPVFSPVSGRVVEAVDGLPDEPPGSANRENPWGNHVVIYDLRGFYAVLAHFSPGTLRVKKGDWVVKGTVLGLCGSSGYAPEPHLHFHIQHGPEIGSPTLPFVFSGYLEEGLFKDFSLPVEGSTVEPLAPDKALKKRLNLLLGQKLAYSLYENGSLFGEIALSVEMAPDGTFYLTDGQSRLYFALKEKAFYFLSFEGRKSSPLKWLFLAAPKVPLALKPGLRWEDSLPLEIGLSGFKKEWYLFLISFYPRYFQIKARYESQSLLDFSGKINLNNEKIETKTVLAEDVGFEEIEIKIKNRIYQLRRKR
ncbi:urea transporter [Thermosulfurimonas dismutans]|uniref:M23ase beta-sheet core domain-containing protein n=1 Tax=Thermosulfurimonas dismutans TaxID=999894 RepID=A0A179D2P9_9BACT|nr:urea transporter [Thermosulfurimonas dismutans]OAQ20354.1 hypothetical protein TDIS_1549 [Thermosulfurimonas dismutans]